MGHLNELCDQGSVFFSILIAHTAMRLYKVKPKTLVTEMSTSEMPGVNLRKLEKICGR